MRNEPTLRPTPPQRFQRPLRPLTDGWLGTREFPGYRAGQVIVRLDQLPKVDPEHLYFDLLLLDAEGRAQDHHSGPCSALTRQQTIDERSRFVRVVAELVRDAPSHDRGITAIGQALSYIRERGVEADRLVTAAQLLDNVCSEPAVIASLCRVLELSLGDDGAHREMCDVVAKLARASGFGAYDSAEGAAPPTGDFASRVDGINEGGLASQVLYVVRTVGKTVARRYLREVIYFDMVPKPDLLGV